MPPEMITNVMPAATIALTAYASRTDRDRAIAAGFREHLTKPVNPDILLPGERSASTSNRNFEGRQGAGGRTHLVSPEMAAAAAIGILIMRTPCDGWVFLARRGGGRYRR